MKAKTITAIFLTSMLTLMWSSAIWAADRFNTRDNRQTRSIHQGIRSGKIIRPEARYLKKEQRRIDRAYNRSLADGYLNRYERSRLNKMQDRAGRHIRRAKHNHGRRHLRRHYYHNRGHRAFHYRRGVVYNHNEYYYYPVTETEEDNSDGYEFSAGVSDTGWQFGFSVRNSQ